ncbi:MAG: hypothetical protein DME26_02475 [Verrucomicrobia bacterium]|nr:MAG: hypothetical protein DME26_02475 [Verrucomicrobiota bacterium]
MKRLLFSLGGLFSSVSLFAQILPTPWTVTTREPHASVWESIRAVTDPITGEQRAERHSFVELATSLNYFDEATGQWLPSAQVWQVLPGGIVYQFGRHKIILAQNINDPAQSICSRRRPMIFGSSATRSPSACLIQSMAST